jgi:hypothetical protein
MSVKEIFVIVVFFILAVSFTCPLIFCFSKSIYGFSDFKGDPLGTMWWIWWYGHAWTNSLDANFVQIVGCPFGLSLKGLPIAPLLNYPIVLLNLVMQNEIITYNLVTLFGIFFTSVCAFLLIRYLTGSGVAGFLGGLIFGFCPNQIMHAAQHMGFVLNFWIILYVFSLFKLKDIFCLKNILFCILSGVGTVLTNYYYGYFVLIFTGSFLLYWYNALKIKMKYILIAFAAILLLCIPFVLYFLVKKNPGVPLSQPIGDLFKYSAHWYDYFLPSEFHPFFGFLAAKLNRHYFERSLYLGFVPLLLAVWGCIKGWSNNNIRFIAITGIVFFIITLSPVFNVFGLKIPNLSYFLFKILPMFRVYARIGIFVILSVAVLAGYGLKTILDSLKGRWTRGCVVFLCSGIVIFEFINFPPFHNIDLSKTPEVYTWLKNEPSDVVVAEYPLVRNIEAKHSEYLFYQRIHKKALVNGASEGTIGDAFRKEVQYLYFEETGKLLAYLGADYIIVHKDSYSVEDLLRIKDSKGLTVAKEFSDSVAYKINADPAKLPVVFWQNIANIEKWEDGNYWRWMGNNATIWVGNGQVMNPKSQVSTLNKVNISFKIIAFAKERELDVYINDHLIKKIDVFPKGNLANAQKVVLENILLQPGGNIIRFYTPQGEDRITDIVRNGDERSVSFAISELKIEEVL